MKPKIYLAGPDVFAPNAFIIGERLKQLCYERGLEGIFPLDGTPIDLKAPNAAKLIYNRCIHHMRTAEAMIANITPFRGPHMDCGTAFEIGYARHAGLPVFLYSNDQRASLAQRLEPFSLGARGEWIDSDGMLIENFGLVENLMITPEAGGRFTVHTTAEAAIAACAGDVPGVRHAE